MKHLCDSNVFVALTLEAHPHHGRAVQWMEERPHEATVYFCRATQISYLRLLTVREWMKEHVCTNDEAIAAYRTLRADPRIGFLTDEPSGLEEQWLKYAGSSLFSPKRWMDAYLAALACCARMPFVTFDRGFTAFSGVDLLVLNE